MQRLHVGDRGHCTSHKAPHKCTAVSEIPTVQREERGRLTPCWAMLGLAPRYKFYQIRVHAPSHASTRRGADAACKAERRNRPEPSLARRLIAHSRLKASPVNGRHCTLICEAAKQSACPPANRNMLYHLEAAWLPYYSPSRLLCPAADPVVGWPAFIVGLDRCLPIYSDRS